MTFFRSVSAFSLFLISILSNASVQERNTAPALYTNPVLHADFSDPDVIRDGDRFILTVSSFQESPALPLLTSPDLVHWTIIGHAMDSFPSQRFSIPRFGDGVWAPSIRKHDGWYYIYFGDPDTGIFMVRSKTVTGKWNAPVLVKSGKGLIDPCPLWDDDGSAYLVHAWAKSRAGFNSMLTVNRMNSDGTTVTDSGRFVYDAHEKHPTMEGPKFYKFHGEYYIFAPAGGVKQGWQTVLRGPTPYGPWRDSIVLRQGSTDVNGPHQGAWVTDTAGASWFLHFQDRGAYGRILHLQPMVWQDGWPVMGKNGEPVTQHTMPASGTQIHSGSLQSSDDFNETVLSPQWQWNANARPHWASLTDYPGSLRLFAVPRRADQSGLTAQPNLLLQKFPARSFNISVTIDAAHLREGEQCGIGVTGAASSFLLITRYRGKLEAIRTICTDALTGREDSVITRQPLSAAVTEVLLRVDSNAVCTYSFRVAQGATGVIGPSFTAVAGRWIGARFALVAAAEAGSTTTGFADIDGVIVTTDEKEER